MSNQQMQRITLALSVLLLLATAGCGQKAAPQVATGRFVEVTIPAPSLEGNLLGDPTEQPASIYLPPSYDTSPNKRYPVIYLLHGYAGTNRTWMVNSESNTGDETPPGSTDIGYGYNIQPVLDALIASGKIQEMIVVAPNAWNAYKGSFFVNSVATGNWEDYIFQDVVNYVDGNYRTLARVASRGIAGHSMGGFGAIYNGMKHPDVFSAVYALAPSRLASFGPISSEGIKELDAQWERIMTRMLRLTSKEQLPLVTRKSREDGALNSYLAWFAAFSPNPNRPPLYADYAYEERDGKLVKNDAVFEKAKENIPIFMIDEFKENLLSLRGLIMDYGEHDGNRPTGAQFSKALADRSIPHTFEIYAGGDHNNKIKERLETRVFPYFSDLLDFSQQ